ncbi:hypothetical protein FACS1894162_1790 [Bacteroidia bacterium]|nr:hypothetical protein FACS1894162_1790 [Bacteroidia bacterium]
MQIAENISRQILEEKLRAGDRVPSVQDLAANFEVNRNTVCRIYTLLYDAGIFDNFFIACFLALFIFAKLYA